MIMTRSHAKVVFRAVACADSLIATSAPSAERSASRRAEPASDEQRQEDATVATVDRGAENEPAAVVPGAIRSALDGSTGREPAPEAASWPTVALVPWDVDEWAIVIQAGSDSADLAGVIAKMPAGLEFSESHGDVDVILVYRAPQTPCPGPVPTHPPTAAE